MLFAAQETFFYYYQCWKLLCRFIFMCETMIHSWKFKRTCFYCHVWSI